MARKPLFKRVSAEERRADAQRQVLERLLQVLDESYDRAEAAAEVLFTLNSPTDIADRYLQIFGDTLDHEWRTDKTYDWNRTRIEEAIERASRKGTPESIEDLLVEHGAQWWRITDMASRLDIWNRQGGWNSPNGIVMAADFYHDGAYFLEFDSNLDFDAFLIDFEKQKKLGVVWWFSKQVEPTMATTGMVGTLQIVSEMDSCARDYSGLSWNREAHSNWLQEVEVSYPGTLGRYLYANSSIPVNAPGLTVNMGTYEEPLIEPWSLMQAPVVVIEEENI